MFADDFNRANESLLASANWTSLGGADASSFLVASNQLQHAGGTLAAACPDQGATDHYSACSITVDATNMGFFLTARMLDDQNFWGVYINSGEAQPFALYKRAAGTFTLIGTAAIPGGTVITGDVIRIDASGSTITASYNGVAKITTTDSFNAAQTRQGFCAFTGAVGTTEIVDNFVADALAQADVFPLPDRGIFKDSLSTHLRM